MMIPTELVPRWRDLGALGWLATRRLGGPVVRIPVLGLIACALTWPVIMTVLIGAHADRALAARGRAALVMVSQCEPPVIRWRRLLASAAALPIAVVVLVLPPLTTIVAAVMAEASGYHRVSAVLAAVALLILVMTAVLPVACAAPAFRSISPIQRRTARALARRRGVTLIEASALAADHAQRRAATNLVRHLRRYADAQNLAVLATPRDGTIATLYQRIGFEPITAGRDRMLVRWPNNRRPCPRWDAGPRRKPQPGP
jgi:hypothetical protein